MLKDKYIQSIFGTAEIITNKGKRVKSTIDKEQLINPHPNKYGFLYSSHRCILKLIKQIIENLPVAKNLSRWS